MKSKFLKELIAKWGVNAQLLMVVEENSELIEKLSNLNVNILHYLRGRKNISLEKESIAEEIVDIILMLNQLIEILGISDLVIQQKEIKIKRIAEKSTGEAVEELKIYYKKNRQEIREKNRQKEELLKKLNGD